VDLCTREPPHLGHEKIPHEKNPAHPGRVLWYNLFNLAPLAEPKNAEAQVRENAGAAGWALRRDDFDQINQWSKAFGQATPRYAHFFDTTVVK
jgi:diketogulonate reductase-like aldo/keto reductase